MRGAPPYETRTAWYWLPAVGLWKLVSRIEGRLGIVRSLLLGLGLVALGLLFCITFVGILIGLPTMALGAALFLRAVI